jgi:hypothetical protein
MAVHRILEAAKDMYQFEHTKIAHQPESEVLNV